MSSGEGTDKRLERLNKALDDFDKWTNYMLITTTGAVAWTASQALASLCIKLAVFWFACSAIAGILTLSLVPIVRQRLRPDSKSIYLVRINDTEFAPGRELDLMSFCAPQHCFLITGLLLYCFHVFS